MQVYLDGCTSISSTGRAAPERFVFLSTVLPTAVLLMMYWRLNFDWLRQLRGRTEAADRAMLGLGLVAALGLIAYVSVLGLPGSGPRLARRVSVALFYLLTYAGEVVLTWQLSRLRSEPRRTVGRARLWLLSAVCTLVLAGAIVSLGLMALWDGYRELEDAFEWSLTALIFVYLPVTGSAWRASGFTARW